MSHSFILPGISLILLISWSIASSLSVYPHSLSYFNELAGGPENGYKHLNNSNIDWGQDLLYLLKWLKEHPEASSIRVAYNNHISSRLIGREFQPPPPDPCFPLSAEANKQIVGPQPGYFAVDVNSLTSGPYRYFQHFQPIAKAGYSIFIYYISEKDAHRLRTEMGLPPVGCSDSQ